jgi:FAD/FMN-containing dehydrogenase
MVHPRSHNTMATKITPAAAKSFVDSVSGPVLFPDSPGYDDARRIFNHMIDRYPALIVQCQMADDVARTVDYARTTGLPLAVRGGGHSVAGYSTCDDGIVVDLSPMKRVQIDVENGTASAEAGLTLGELDRATQEHGLATPLGIVSVTGIAGLTLGGGLGWLNGKHGLACDNVLGVEIVTADGRMLRADSEEHPDLYWAIRGGSGNFGVVTRFDYQLHPVGPVFGGIVIYSMEDTPAALRGHRAFTAQCPDNLSTAAVLASSPDGDPVLIIACCYAGPIEDGERAVETLTSFGTPLATQLGVMEFTQLQSMLDPSFPEGNQHYWRAGYLREISNGAIDVLVEFALSRPSPLTAIGLQHLHGAAARVDPAATAFAHRADQFDCMVLGQWTDPANNEENIQWVRDFFAEMRPHFGPGVYVNNLGDEGQDRVRAAYGQNYDRLVAIKTKYDPENIFRLNHNITPNEQVG